MNILSENCCVLNAGNGAWAFEPLALQLSSALGVDIAEKPRRFNYLLNPPEENQISSGDVFIPMDAVRLAADKRLLAAAFLEHGVPTPETALIDDFSEVLEFVREHAGREWCLKYPTSCGANGHRFVTAESEEPPNWPRPFIVQEFIRMQRPEVYRTFCAAGELFGWVARRFPEGSKPSPWVAHARGARYVRLEGPPSEAESAATLALKAVNLWDTFGCVDLLCRDTGEWVVLEVGTDGVVNHVDRDLDDPTLEGELLRRVAESFWKEAQRSAHTAGHSQ